MAAKPRVLFLPSWFPTREKPYLGNFILRHAKAAGRSAHVTVFLIVPGNKFRILLQQESGLNTLRTEYPASFNRDFFSVCIEGVQKFRAFFYGVNFYRKQFGQPNLLHLNVCWPGGIFALFAKRIWNIPFALSEHWSQLHPNAFRGLNIFKQRMIRKVFSEADIILPVSQNLLESILKLSIPGKTIELVPNAVDIEVFKPLGKSFTVVEPFILHVSTLDEPVKNVFGILRVLSKLKENRQKFKCLIVHEFPSPEHESYARKLGLTESEVQFLGSKTESEVADLMRKASFLLAFSRVENQPVVVIEALASGLPVLCSRVGDLENMVPKEFGMLVNSEDEEGLFTALEKMIQAFPYFPFQEMAKFAESRYSMEVVGLKLGEIYARF